MTVFARVVNAQLKNALDDLMVGLSLSCMIGGQRRAKGARRAAVIFISFRGVCRCLCRCYAAAYAATGVRVTG